MYVLTNEKMSERVYMELLKQYLEFFLPNPKSIRVTIQSTPIKRTVQQERRVGWDGFNVETLDGTSVFTCTAVDDLSFAVYISQFIAECISELWLCQNDYELLESPGMKIPVFEL